MPRYGPADRRRLRDLLVQHAPWLIDDDAGPSTVDAGNCDRCDQLPRLLPTCGPLGSAGLCRECALTVGVEAWCDGHREASVRLLAWARQLPDNWNQIVVAYWLATGELKYFQGAPPIDEIVATFDQTERAQP